LPPEHVAPATPFALHEPWSQKLPLVHCVSLPQLTGHVPLDPVHRYGAQLGVPRVPAERKVHVPGVALHTSQLPAHALLQQ
jgi:hypothetical protein